MTAPEPRAPLRLAGAVIALEIVWLVAAEAWREASPGRLLAFVLVAWMLLAVAWQILLPSRAGTTARLLASLVLVNGAIDLLSPYPPRFSFLPWEVARAVAVVVASFVARRWTAGAIARRASAALRAGSLALAAVVPLAMLYIGVSGARDEAAPADVALVLGFALDDSGAARPQLVARVEHAVRIHRRGLAPRLVLSGGAAKAGHTEAGVMRDLALARGVPADALVLDEAARSTIENFACAIPILERLGARKVLVVTEPWHMRRAMLLARRHGLDALAAPATSPIWESPRHAAYWLFRDANAFVVESLRNAWAAPGRCASAECEGCRRF